MPDSLGNCVWDRTFAWTNSINTFLNKHESLTDAYIIICSLMMDIMMLNLFFWWSLMWKSFRPILAYLLFFGCRGIIQVRSNTSPSIYRLKYPINLIL
jgi:hypothetical protein